MTYSSESLRIIEKMMQDPDEELCHQTAKVIVDRFNKMHPELSPLFTDFNAVCAILALERSVIMLVRERLLSPRSPNIHAEIIAQIAHHELSDEDQLKVIGIFQFAYTLCFVMRQSEGVGGVNVVEINGQSFASWLALYAVLVHHAQQGSFEIKEAAFFVDLMTVTAKCILGE
jgi:hypothetical protein